MGGFAKFVALQLLRGYKWGISPLFPPACRYVPTCSEYAMEAVDRYGAVRGTLKAFLRLLRCHPFAHGGYDPVVKHFDCDEAPDLESITRDAASSGQRSTPPSPICDAISGTT
jgi:putative membrane protein insertion efficiency factor